MRRKYKKGEDLKSQWGAFVDSANESAYRELYIHYYKYLTYIGLKKGNSAAKVKDCINDLFLYLWENTDKLLHVQNHHNYIVTAFLRRLAKIEHFSAELSVELEENLQELPLELSPESLHIQNNMQLDVARILKSYVEKLPRKQRQMIYQKFYLGLSYQDIALANHVSIHTVYSSIYNALDKLRSKIGKEQMAALYLALTALSIFCLFFLKNFS